jgi:hypothetical protein
MEPSPQDRALAQAELTECLKTYDLLGNRREAEEIVRVKVVQPFIKKVRKLLSSNRSNS